MSTLSGKQFGLIKRTSKKASAFIKKPSIFEDDSDEEPAHEAVNKSLEQEARKSKVKKQTQLEIQKALQEDPTVYEYDSIYDEMEKKKQEKIVQKKTDKSKKPKYIEGLMKAAKVRNREREKMMERKIQNERENEGEMAETDAFVTSAYRKKLEEIKHEEDKERREAEMEAKLDVTKQKDLSGFYRYLYRETGIEATTNQEASKAESQEGSQPSNVKTERLAGEQKESIDHQPNMDKYDSCASDMGQGEYRKGKTTNKIFEYYPEEKRHKDNHLNQRHRERQNDQYGKKCYEHRSKGREETYYKENKKKRDNEDCHKTSSEIDESHEKRKYKKYDRKYKEDYQVKSKPDDGKERRNDKSTLNKESNQERREKDEKKTEKPKSKYSKRNVGECVMSAKDRYLARQMARVATKTTAPIEEND